MCRTLGSFVLFVLHLAICSTIAPENILAIFYLIRFFTNFRSVTKKSVVKKSVGHAELNEDNEQIENLTTNETKEIYIVPERKSF